MPPPPKNNSVSRWTWTQVPSIEQSKTAHVVKFRDTARIELSRVETNRSYCDRTSVSLDSSHALWHICGDDKRKYASAFAALWSSASLFNSGNNPAAFRFSASMCDMLGEQWFQYINSNYFQTIIPTRSAFCKSGAHKSSWHAADTSIF